MSILRPFLCAVSKLTFPRFGAPSPVKVCDPPQTPVPSFFELYFLNDGQPTMCLSGSDYAGVLFEKRAGRFVLFDLDCGEYCYGGTHFESNVVFRAAEDYLKKLYPCEYREWLIMVYKSKPDTFWE